MQHDVVMPGLSPGMTEGVIVAWRKGVGDQVRAGDVLFEVETDKAVMEVEAALDGMLAEVRAPAGGPPIRVNSVIAVIAEEGYVAAPAPSPAPAPADAPPVRAAPAAPAARAASAPRAETPRQRAALSPLARRMARERGVDVSRIPGSGPGGRIVRADVEKASTQSVPPLARAPGRTPAHTERTTIAIPTLTLSTDCAADNLLDFCTQLSQRTGPSGIAVVDVLVRIAGIALKRCAGLNATWIDGAVVQGTGNHVALARGGGVTVIESADTKELGAIAADRRAPAAQQGKRASLSIACVEGVRQFAGTLHESHGAALTTGAIEARPWAVDGKVVVRAVMTCSLTCDARVADAAAASRFMGEVRTMIEDPRRMLL